MDAALSPARLGSTPPAGAGVLRRRWPLLLLGGAATAAAVLIGMHLRQSTTTTYVTAPIDRGAITRSITASGTVNPVLTILVGSYVSGVIQSIACDYNTQVVRGQVCAQIDPRPYQVLVDQNGAALAAARAQLGKDRASLRYDEVNLSRLSTLLQQDSTSRDAVDVARSARDQALAQIALDDATIRERQADLKAAEVNLGYTRITSPVDGTVVSRNVTQGQTVAASFQTPTLFLIATDLTKMEVDANVSESDIGGAGAALTQGAAASFTVDAFPGRTFHGVVSQIRQAPQSVQNVVTYDVVIAVDNGDHRLKPGMTATTRIITASRKGVLRVPVAALRFHPGQTAVAGQSRSEKQVYILRDGRPAAVAVSSGLSDDTFTELASGAVNAGDAVIVGQRQDARARPSRPGFRF